MWGAGRVAYSVGDREGSVQCGGIGRVAYSVGDREGNVQCGGYSWQLLQLQ